MNESDTDDIQVVETPATFHLKQPERTFIVRDVGAWGYTDNGYFATGYFVEETYTAPPELSLIIPYDNVAYIELDFDALAVATAAEVIELTQPDEQDEAEAA